MNQIAGCVRRLAALVLCACLLAAGLSGCSSAWNTLADSAAADGSPVSKEDLDYDASLGVIDTKKFEGTVLPETQDAGAQYVADALFLGDSNTVRFMMYGDEKTGEAYTTIRNNIGVVSMGVGAITTLKCEEFSGMSSAVTMPEAVKILQPQRIIITFGTNNLSGTSTNAEKFIDTYKKGLKAIHEAYPYAALIVNSIPPLDAQRENSRLSQTQVDAYNEAICEMCTAEGYKYLNSAEALKDETTGWAKKDYTLGDGVHLSKNGVDALFAYIRTHAYENEDTRPKPLKKIPTPKGVQPGLVKNDPIAVRGARVQISVVAGEGGTVSPTDTSAKATLSVSLSAVPNEGFEFTGWELVSGVASFSDTAASTTTLTVNSGNDANGIVVRANFRAIEIEEETWGDWETDEAPTCLDEGKAHRTSNRGNREDKTLDAKGHDWIAGDWSWSGDGPTQTGTLTYTCSRCGETRTEQTSRDNPNYTAPTPEPQPTETPSTPAPETPGNGESTGGESSGGEGTGTPDGGGSTETPDGTESGGSGSGGEEPGDAPDTANAPETANEPALAANSAA